jgi:hypothetical protein
MVNLTLYSRPHRQKVTLKAMKYRNADKNSEFMEALTANHSTGI